LKETDMYPAVRHFLVSQGYTVRSEVRGCDVVAEKDGRFVVLEMKTRLSVALLAQAASRQRAVESVYVVIPHPGDRVKTREWRQTCHLLRRLELGLLLVTLPATGEARVDVVQHPVPFEPRRRKKERAAIIQEMHGRSGDHNRGGSSGKKLLTAYRENAVMIAAYLAETGPATPARLRELGTGPKTLSILSNNFYGWFERVARGIYALTPKGRDEASSYAELWNMYGRRYLESTGS
jgi:hypothetical protein